jgi:hypothetical protein
VPMIAPMRPPRSKMSLSPMPNSSVKMKNPMRLPASPSRIVTKKPPGSFDRYSVSHRVFGDHPGLDELEQVVRASRLRADA